MLLSKIECDNTRKKLEAERHKKYLAREEALKVIGTAETFKSDLSDVILINNLDKDIKTLDVLIEELRGN